MSKRSIFKHIQINRQEFWKQTSAVVVGNFEFIDKVGQCFSAINQIEEDLMAFTDERTKEVTNHEPVPVANDYYLPAMNPDSIFLK